MSFFELAGANGVDGDLSGSNDDLQVQPTNNNQNGRLHVFIYNATDTVVSMELLTGHADLEWVFFGIDTAIHDVADPREIMIEGTGNRTLRITAMQPGTTLSARIQNDTGTARNALDVSHCRVTSTGHGSNIFNGQRVWITTRNDTTSTNVN